MKYYLNVSWESPKDKEQEARYKANAAAGSGDELLGALRTATDITIMTLANVVGEKAAIELVKQVARESLDVGTWRTASGQVACVPKGAVPDEK